MPSYWHNVHARMLSHVALAKQANQKAHMHGKEVVSWMDIVDSLVGWLVGWLRLCWPFLECAWQLDM
jgi:hypothetical protein